MFSIFWFLLLYLMTTIAVSTVQARCSFIPDCKACYVSTYGDSREQDLWTVVCKNSLIDCVSFCSALRSLNATVELLDVSHTDILLHCSHTCSFYSNATLSVYEIDMSSTSLHNIASFGRGLTYFLNSFKDRLRTLKLQYVRLYGETLSFSSYPMLRNLDLSGTFTALHVFFGRVSLVGAVYLETLYLDNNHLVYVPYEIRNMTSLKHLSLQHNFLNKTSLNKPDIFPLTLESLDLSHNNFQGSADFSWMNSVNLRTLRMQNTSIGYYGLPKRLGNMSNLEILDVSASVLSINPFYYIEVFSRLRIFNFSFNRLREVPTAIKKSRLLHQLYLRSNDITYVAPKTFVNISNMTVLDLGCNKISSLPTFAFSGVEESLELLYLDGNQLETLDKCTILRVTRLRGLRIGGNPFHCDCKIAWLRSYRDRGVDIDVDRAFCNSPLEFKGMGVSVFWTESCTLSHFSLSKKDCFELISPASNAITETSPNQNYGVSDAVSQVTADEAQPLTSFARQTLASAYLALGFSATCLAIIVFYLGYRLYRRYHGRKRTKNTNSERTMPGVQGTNFSEAGETGPYQELESVSPYQNVANLNRSAENSYEALNPHTAI